jgi:hypothetical protein
MNAVRVPFGILVLAGLLGGTSAAFAQSGQALSKQNLDLPYDALSLAEDDENAPEVVVFYGSTYEGDGFFYALDRSGSTQNSGELQREKQEVVRNIAEFTDRVEFGVAFYDRGLVKWPASGRPAQANSGQKGAASAWVMGTPGGGGSCVGLGIIACVDFANQSSARRNVVIWLGDGCTTCPGKDATQYGNQTLAEITARNFQRHQINAIAVGPDSEVCPNFPKSLAAQNQGAYSRIPR